MTSQDLQPSKAATDERTDANREEGVRNTLLTHHRAPDFDLLSIIDHPNSSLSDQRLSTR